MDELTTQRLDEQQSAIVQIANSQRRILLLLEEMNSRSADDETKPVTTPTKPDNGTPAAIVTHVTTSPNPDKLRSLPSTTGR